MKEVFAQVLNVSTNPSNGGSSFTLNGPKITVASGVEDDREPDVAALADGTFIVTWTGSTISENGQIFGTVFNNNGSVHSPNGVPQDNITLSAVNNDAQFESTVAVLNNGNIVTTYSDASGDRDVFATIASKNLNGIYTVSSPFQVNTIENGDGGLPVRQDQPSVTALSNGGFVVVFVTHFTSGDLDVRGRIFDANGTPAGNDFVIDNLSFIQTKPSVTALPDGSFAVSYSDSRDSVSGSSAIDANITTQVYSNAGVKIGNSIFNANTTQSGVQGNSTVTALDDGRFLLTWTDENGSGGGDVRYQIMDARDQTINASAFKFGQTIVGKDTGQGTPGDIMVGDGRDNTMFGLAGDDTLNGGGGTDTLHGGDDADVLRGDGGDDTLFGGQGEDELRGGDNDDTLDGGADFDVLGGDNGNDTYVLVDGLDSVIEASGTASGIDTITSTIGRNLGSFANVENLTLLGTGNINGTGSNALANVITANSGNNILSGGIDNLVDRLIGGGGNDTYVLGTSSNDIVIEAAGAAGGVDTVNSTVSRTLAANVENLVLQSTGNINGTGNTIANIITGNSANNVLSGGVDTVVDRLIGGAGNDTYALGATTGDVVVEAVGAAGGVDTVTSTISRSLGSNVENLILQGTAALGGFGNTLANTIIGSSSANLLSGGLATIRSPAERARTASFSTPRPRRPTSTASRISARSPTPSGWRTPEPACSTAWRTGRSTASSSRPTRRAPRPILMTASSTTRIRARCSTTATARRLAARCSSQRSSPSR